MDIQYGQLQVLPPEGKGKDHADLTLTVIHATERGTPPGREKIAWKLRTNLPVKTLKAAIEKRNWYALRWKTEVFHKMLKTGCKAEESKLRSSERLANLIAIFCIIGWRVFWLTMLHRARPDLPPARALETTELRLLDELVKTKPEATARKATVSDYTIKIARLGGYLNRASDPPPAKLRSVIEAKVSGKIDQRRVVPGQKVKRGEVLARVEAREMQSRLDQTMAVRQQAEGDLKRFASLLEQKILSQSEYDGAQSKFKVAAAAVKEAETLLSYTKITAPFDGTITRKHADVGDLASPGKPRLDMEDSRALRLEADVPEAVVGRLTLGDKLPVRIAALETELEGVVSEIAPAADSGSRTFLVKLDLPTQPGLRAGQFGRVAMPVGETSALRVPVSAVVQRGQMEIIFIVSDNKAQLRLVKTGKRIGSEVELVSGVTAGEKIVIENAAGLIDSQPLTVTP